MAWTEITRPKYQRDGLRYASDTTDEEWALIEPYIPPPASCGRTRETSMRRWSMPSSTFNWLWVFQGGRIWQQAAAVLGFQSAPSNRVRSSFLEGQNGWKPGWASDSHAIGVGAV